MRKKLLNKINNFRSNLRRIKSTNSYFDINHEFSYWAEKGKDYTVSCTGNGNPSPTLAVVGPDGSHDSPYRMVII